MQSQSSLASCSASSLVLSPVASPCCYHCLTVLCVTPTGAHHLPSRKVPRPRVYLKRLSSRYQRKRLMLLGLPPDSHASNAWLKRGAVRRREVRAGPWWEGPAEVPCSWRHPPDLW
jgi:hypothetical protein